MVYRRELSKFDVVTTSSNFFVYKNNTYIVDHTMNVVKSRLLFKGYLLVDNNNELRFCDSNGLTYPLDKEMLYNLTSYNSEVIDDYIDDFIVNNNVIDVKNPFKVILDKLGLTLLKKVPDNKVRRYVNPTIMELYDAMDNIASIYDLHIQRDGNNSYKKHIARYLNVKPRTIKIEIRCGRNYLGGVVVLRASLKIKSIDDVKERD
jgi:hypothetical protein